MEYFRNITVSAVQEGVKHGEKRFIEPLSVVNNIDFDISGVLKDINADKEMEKKFKTVFELLSANLNAINTNLEAIKSVEVQIDPVTEAISKFNQETKLILQEMRLEMRSNFQDVLRNNNELHVDDKISSITIFIEYFWKSVDSLNDLSPNTRVVELEKPDGILDNIRKNTNADGSLTVSLNYLINQKLAYPKELNDKLARHTSHVMYLGVQTYISSLFFFLQEYTFLANFYYEGNNTDKYNEYLDSLIHVVAGIKRSLLGNDGQKGFIEEIINIIGEVSELPFMRSKKTLYDLLQQKKESLKQAQNFISETTSYIIADQPQMITATPNFNESTIQTPIGDWKDGEMVSYAMQFEKNDVFSKIGEWSKSVIINGKASPLLTIPIDTKGRRRIIYRKFNNRKLEFIGAIDDASQTTLRDINRDLYNAALNSNENKAMEEMEILIRNGANTTAVFEGGRQPIHGAAQIGNVNLTRKFLLVNNATDINAKDTSGFTVMHIAAAVGHKDFVELLLEHDASITKTDSQELTPLHIAAFSGHDSVLKALMTADAAYLIAPDSQGFAPIHAAVFGGLTVLQTLLSNDSVNLNAKSNAGLTPLHLAVWNKYHDIVGTLLKNENLDINATAEGDLTALHFAAITGNVDMIELLCSKKDINVNAASIYGWTPLHFAAALEKEEAVKEMLGSDGVSVDVKAGEGVNLLYLAVNSDQKSIVASLLEKGAAIEAETKRKHTALHLATMRGHLNVLRTLVERGANMEAKTFDNSTSLLLAASSKSGNIDVLKYLIEKGADEEAYNDNHDTFIFLIARFGSVELVKYVIENFDALQKVSLEGDTILHSAVRGNNMAVAKYLVEEKEFDINTVNHKMETPLCIARIINDSLLMKYLKDKQGTFNPARCENPVEQAVQNGDLNLLKRFIKKDVSSSIDLTLNGTLFQLAIQFNQKNILKYLIQKKVEMGSEWGTSLHAAVEKLNMELIKYMVENGADVNAIDKDDDKSMPLHKAAFKSKGLDVVKYLVEKGALVNAKTGSGLTPLHFVAMNGNAETAKFLMNNGADGNATDKWENTPLHIAVEISTSLDVVKCLVQKGVSVNAKNVFGMTPLHFAVIPCDIETVKFLTENGADVNARDKTESIPLHKAVENSFGFETIEYLVKKGALVNAEDDMGRTPLHNSIKSVDTDIIELLIDNGADVNAKDKSGETPLNLSFDVEIDEFLYSKGGFRSRRSIKNDHFLIGAHKIEKTLASNPNNHNQIKVVGLEPSFKELSDTTQPFSEAQQTGSSSGFLTVENLAFIGCIAETLDQSASKRFHRLKNQGINVIPNTNAAVYDARERFREYVEEKIDTFGQEVQKVIRKELEKVDTDITESLMRGVEFSGLVGLDHVLKMCKQCFEDNLLKNVLDSGEV